MNIGYTSNNINTNFSLIRQTLKDSVNSKTNEKITLNNKSLENHFFLEEKSDLCDQISVLLN